jgi:hypothetical protein
MCDNSEATSADPCACKDCKDTSACVKDQCINDGFCTAKDACICSDCWEEEGFCSDPDQSNCRDNGVCDSYFEGCYCLDCKDKPQCVGFPGNAGAGGAGGEGGAGSTGP